MFEFTKDITWVRGPKEK